MSRSYKKSIFKDKGFKDIYWKTIRRITKNIIKTYNTNHYVNTQDINMDYSDEFDLNFDEKELDYIIRNPKEIINDYNYCDYIINYEYYENDKEKLKKKRRK